MSIANDILTDVLSKLSTQLGSTFSELPNLFSEDETTSRQLDNGYSALLSAGSNDENQVLSQVRITRLLTIKISYRTFRRPGGSKTKTTLATLHTNEEALIPLFLNYASKPAGLLGIVDPVTTTVETFPGEDDDFLINTLTFNTVYEFSL